MNPLVAEWIEKAEGDFATALREIRARKNPNYDAACFHSQQCVEKYFKGILQSATIPFGKTHDLCVLLDACIQMYPLWEAFRLDLEALTEYAVAFRYPGLSADRDKAKMAVVMAKRLRKTFRLALNIEEP
ncbi:MAG: HEPN domain-containing protein [Planctomycetes bacterium]|nr:HEPN domain-containing protein [Planctomycetota bacterium]MBU4398320.1 HEPN domain-containing protein [Planctomycetota bacterium]MCG2682972.1 HEPN domain-containing protein [Planctomycetales bacterium]